ncbi:peroxisomal membrane protein 2-like [Gigantopelta aegis]|uniref:peroxisomal membrane protein 2-like n=1 Tax=Gigantopelta aegis TaxID=1735272 RepID=UPI001B88D8BB|nr:peroxisomal membrane protein 2-like [Gigantopelta aegis]
MSWSKEKDDNALDKALNTYSKLIQERPVLTKAITSACISSLGNILSQLIVPSSQLGNKIAWRSVLSYASFGFFISGPVVHHWYRLLEHLGGSKKDSTVVIKKILADRLLFTPPFIFTFLYVISILEGHGHKGAMHRIKEVYWYILKTNWKAWTAIQFFIIKYIPMKYRVLVGNFAQLVMTIFISYKRRQMSS